MEKAQGGKAIVILHEIYGINDFILDRCREYEMNGFTVFCPNLLGRNFFPYEEKEEAYRHFQESIGFKSRAYINSLIDRLKEDHDKVFLLGFSVGATLAWLCCQNPRCDGIICCYGSRIRDSIDLVPACKTLMLFARNEPFAVRELMDSLGGKPNLTIVAFDAGHGFMDRYGAHFDARQAMMAEETIHRFFNGLGVAAGSSRKCRK